MKTFLKIKIKFALLCVIFLHSCTLSRPNCYQPDYDKLNSVNNVEKKTFSEISNATGLKPFGTGAQMMNEIDMLMIAFQCDKNISIKEGRELLILCADRFLKNINENEQIRQYLKTYPFELKNIEIEIYISSKGSKKNTLSVLACKKGKLDYKTDSDDPFKFKHVHSESYENAIKKIAEMAKNSD